MAILADCINDGKGPQPVLEKKRCLRAIGEMIKLAKAHVSNGLPQVSFVQINWPWLKAIIDMRLLAVCDRK